MELMSAGLTFSGLILRNNVVFAPELFGYLASADNLGSPAARLAVEREVQSRLYLYQLIFSQNISDLPSQVVEELQANRGVCFAVLLHLWAQLGRTAAVPDLIREIAKGGCDGVPEAAVTLLAGNLARLLVEAGNETLVEALEDTRGQLAQPDDLVRLTRLARIVSKSGGDERTTTIAELSELSENSPAPDAASIGAHYLLAVCYRHLGLPLEEKASYLRWREALAAVFQEAPALLAARSRQTEAEFARRILEGHERLIELLHAASEHDAAQSLTDEFEAAGMECGRLRSRSAPQPGYRCVGITHEAASSAHSIERHIADLVTDVSRQKACLILHETATRVEKKWLPLARKSLEALKLRLGREVPKLDLIFEPESVEEDGPNHRLWFLCRQKDNPVNALVLRIGKVGRDIAVQTSRAVAFETGLTPERTEHWVTQTARLLNEPFSTRKLATLKKVLAQGVARGSTRRKATKRAKTH